MGLRTALVSNAGFTTAPSLRLLLDHHGFRPYLDVLVFSDELGLAKPASRTFQHALAGLGCDAKAAAFVGDTPYNDVFGSQSAGLFAVQLGAKARDGIRPEAQIETLADLIPALRAHALLAP